MAQLSQSDFEALAAFRHGVRSFLRFSEKFTAAHGATPAVYQLMLVIKARSQPPDIRAAANALALRHHSAAELVQRGEDMGLVRRERDPEDARRSLLFLTAAGEQALTVLAAGHISELQKLFGRTTGLVRSMRGEMYRTP